MGLILAWLLGVPLGIIVLLFLFGIGHSGVSPRPGKLGRGGRPRLLIGNPHADSLPHRHLIVAGRRHRDRL